MKEQRVDIAVIGGGTAGMTAYHAAGKHTDNLVIIEADKWGTTCARVGCMPSKLLIAAAEISHQVDKAYQFGIDVVDKSVQGTHVMERVKSERDRFVGQVMDTVAKWPEAHRLEGGAVFTGAHSLQVGDHTLVKADRFVIATGSRPALPEAWKTLGDRLITNEDVFTWNDLPPSIIVVGTGPVGLELAQALARLGVITTLIGMGRRFGQLTDPALGEVVEQALARELTLYADHEVQEVARTEQGVRVRISDGRQSQTLEAACLLAATGRRPNLDHLDLPAAGIKVDEKGMPAFNDSTGQIEDSHLFIAGDVSGAHPLLHEAAEDGRIAGDNAGRYPDIRVQPRRPAFSIVFTEPQIMLTGCTYRELADADKDFAVGETSFTNQGRSQVLAKNTGLLRVYGEYDTGKFLGAEMVGPAAEHLGHLLAWSLQQELTVQDMLASPFYHPVVEEGIRSALKKLRSALDLGPPPSNECLECGPGG